MPTPPPPLRFKVAPNIVEDLGLNLYTELPRVLAEFVANAYDADSPCADVSIDHASIAQARSSMRAEHKQETKEALAEGRPTHTVDELATRTLPSNLTITIEDQGCGMSRHELGDKFLVAGRRRREFDPNPRTPGKKRLIMGRKGLGKLAGFGVAKTIEVTSRKKGETHATKITLDYDELVKRRSAEDIEVPEKRLSGGGEFSVSGTRVVLSRLMYDPTKSQEATISNQLSEHFELIKEDDFVVRLNKKKVKPLVRSFAYAWPEPDKAKTILVEEWFDTEDGSKQPFRYRMRFTEPEAALPGQRRGVRVYARGRLASAPSLLDADTNMHGFRMTDYLDGVVEADFLDSFKSDFIATDRQSLRWDAPLLDPLRKLLSGEIKEACKQYQKERDDTTPSIVKQDKFTLAEINKQSLAGRDKTLAIRIGSYLAAACKRGVKDPIYKSKLPEILRGIGHGNLVAAIAELAAERHPDLDRVAAKIVELTQEEVGSFVSIARARVKAIAALKKIVKDSKFGNKREEDKVQELLENAPWMIDPAFSTAVAADQQMSTTFDALAKELKIGKHAGPDPKNKKERPDLVFLISSGAGRVVIVELKAPTISLDSTHLAQLEAYMEQAEEWLANLGRPFSVQGHLIGNLDTTGRARDVLALRRRLKKRGVDEQWNVRSFLQLLEETEQVHGEILKAYEKAKL